MIQCEVLKEIFEHMEQSQDRYGDFSSTHEALGVAVEELNELEDAIHANRIELVRAEAIDLAAVCYRLALQCRSNRDLIKRSVK